MLGRLRFRNAYVLLLCIISLALNNSLFAIDIKSLPKPTGYVSDLAHVVNPDDKAKLEALCAEVEQQLGVQFALVTIDTIGDQPIRDFALQLSREWEVGDKKNNQGVLLLLVVQDHKDDIETGRGIEPYITDGFSGSTLRAMRPELRAGDYGTGLLTAARSMANQIAQGKGTPFTDTAEEIRPRREVRTRGGGIPGPLLLLGVVFVLWLISRGGRGRRGGGGGGFMPGFVVGNLLSGGNRSGSGWGGGGFGGDSGGGGGFGGFGGGDFGGGGASSDW